MTDTDETGYQAFIASEAARLAVEPENALSLFSGRDFLQLGPSRYLPVREACNRFGREPAAVHDDLVAAIAAAPGPRSFGRLRERIAITWRVLRTTRHVVKASREGSHAETPDPLVVNGAAHPANDQGSPPRASVVVLSYNRLTYLRETLQAFLDTTQGSSVELIVVDNGSTDGSAPFLETELARGSIQKLALRAGNHGTSAGYNYGFALADPGSSFLMKLDSDIRPVTPGWLDTATAFLDANPEVGFVALNQVNHSMLGVLAPFEYGERGGGTRVMPFGAWPCGSAMIVPRRLRDELGCFIEDGELKYAPDDVDYYSRATRRGYEVFFLADLWVHHQVHLDRARYKPLNAGKPRLESARLALDLAVGYDRGTHPLELAYPAYEGLSVPAGGLVREPS
jgi:GT2 family glycosyltransferase